MAKVVRKIGQVVGTVAAIAAMIPGPHQPIAAAVAAVSQVVVAASSALISPPGAKGQINERIIGANNPQPYIIGRSYSGGVQVHDIGWGGTVNEVQNPYRFIAAVYSCCGPVEELEAVQFDYETISFSSTAATGYYADYFWRDFQLGARPESDALAPQWAGTPGWGTSYKLSGYAAIGYSLQWSKKGKRFAGGNIPIIGAIWKGVKVYDPRLDSTYPGGSGSHRIDDEDTWEYSANPALHALAYAYGRYVNGVKVFGVDLGEAAIDVAKAVAWANVCDTNSWTVNGIIYEPDDKWNNLKRICEAGGAQPVLSKGILTFDYQAPRVSLATVTIDDLAEGSITGVLGKGFKTRVNTISPRYRSEDHQWNYVQAGKVTVSAWVTADGEEKTDERQWDLVTSADQVTELATYLLYQRREDGPFTITCKPHMRLYGPGDCLTLDDELGLHPEGSIKAIVRARSVDPMTGLVSLELEQETDAKHTEALGLTGTAPTPTTLPTSEDIDEALRINGSDGARKLNTKSVEFPLTSDDSSIDVAAFTGTLWDGTQVSFPADSTTLASLSSSTLYAVFFDLVAETYSAVASPATSEMADNTLAFVGWQATSSGGTFPTPGTPPPGYGGDGNYYEP